MTARGRTTIVGGALAMVGIARAAGLWVLEDRDVDPSPSALPSPGATANEAQPGFLYGRIATVGGPTYEGRLRWGGTQEAFWGDFFNGRKDANTGPKRGPP